MRGGSERFFLPVVTTLVRSGSDTQDFTRDEDSGDFVKAHSMYNVLMEQFVQVCRMYRNLPDPRTLTIAEVQMFYDYLRPELRELTRPRDE